MGNAVLANKSTVNKLLLEERKRMRLKQADSKFVRRSGSLYDSLKDRLKRDYDYAIDFTKAQFREWMRAHMSACHYCGTKLSLSHQRPNAMVPDHKSPLSWAKNQPPDHSGDPFTMAELAALANLVEACKTCNWRKGGMAPDTYFALRDWVKKHMDEDEARDFWRRLTTGGKWAHMAQG